MKKKKNSKTAEELHENVPPDWYFRSIKEDPLQRFWHKTRHKEISKLLEPVKGEILDIGSADGVFTKVVLDKTNARKVIGIDVLQSSVDWSNKHWKKEKRMEFRKGDAHKLDFKSGRFDAVVALEVLEHVHEPIKVLKEIKRILKKNGYAVFLVPSESILFKVVWFLWHFYGRMVWKDSHIQDFSKDSLVKILKKTDFKIVENKKFLLGMLHAIKVIKK